MNTCTGILFTLLLMASLAQATQREVAFLGFTGHGAPALEKTYERLLREQLSISPSLRQVDYSTIEYYKRQINFGQETFISRKSVQALQKFAPDTTLFVWGVIKKYQLEPRRQSIVRSVITAKLSLTLMIYSLSFREFIYVGDIETQIQEPAGFILFGDVVKETHINALERTRMLESLERESVSKSVRMIEAVTRNEILKYEQGLRIKKKNSPSLSDLFSIPSVAPPAVDTTLRNSQK